MECEGDVFMKKFITLGNMNASMRPKIVIVLCFAVMLNLLMVGAQPSINEINTGVWSVTKQTGDEALLDVIIINEGNQKKVVFTPKIGVNPSLFGQLISKNARSDKGFSRSVNGDSVEFLLDVGASFLKYGDGTVIAEEVAYWNVTNEFRSYYISKTGFHVSNLPDNNYSQMVWKLQFGDASYSSDQNAWNWSYHDGGTYVNLTGLSDLDVEGLQWKINFLVEDAKDFVTITGSTNLTGSLYNQSFTHFDIDISSNGDEDRLIVGTDNIAIGPLGSVTYFGYDGFKLEDQATHESIRVTYPLITDGEVQYLDGNVTLFTELTTATFTWVDPAEFSYNGLNFSIWDSNVLTWGFGTLTCSAIVNDTLSAINSCIPTSINPNTVYRLQYIVNETTGTAMEFSPDGGHLIHELFGATGPFGDGTVNATCGFNDYDSDNDGAVVCNATREGDRLFLVNINAQKVFVDAAGGTGLEGFMVLVTTGSSIPASSTTRFEFEFANVDFPKNTSNITITTTGGGLNGTLSASLSTATLINNVQNNLFNVTANFSCATGFCGRVNGSLYANLTGEIVIDGLVSNVLGTDPLHVNTGFNPQVCGVLDAGQSCVTSWIVNHTVNATNSLTINATSNNSLVVQAGTSIFTVSSTSIFMLVNGTLSASLVTSTLIDNVQNSLFNVTANLSCSAGFCGQVNSSLYANLTGELVVDGLVSTVLGTAPIHVNTGLNPQVCGVLDAGQFCITSWLVNHTVNATNILTINATSNNSFVVQAGTSIFTVSSTISASISVLTDVDWDDIALQNQIDNIEHFDYDVSINSRNWTGSGSSTVPLNSKISCVLASNPSNDICTGGTNNMLEITRATRPFGFLSTDGSVVRFGITHGLENSVQSEGFRIAFNSDNRSAGTQTVFDPMFRNGWNTIVLFNGGSTNLSNSISQTINIGQSYIYEFELNFDTQSIVVRRDGNFIGDLLMNPFNPLAGGPYLNVTSIGEFDSIGTDWDLDFISFGSNFTVPANFDLGSCADPCKYQEKFDYEDSIQRNNWVVRNAQQVFSNGTCAILPSGDEELVIWHSTPTQNDDLIYTFGFDVEIKNSSQFQNSQFVVTASGKDLLATSVLGTLAPTKDFVQFGFYNDSVTGKNVIRALVRLDQGVQTLTDQTQILCTDCWTEGQRHLVNVTMYFARSFNGFIDNLTFTFRPYDSLSYVVTIDGVIVAENVLMNVGETDVALGFANFVNELQFNQAKVGASSTLQVALCEVILIEGTDGNKSNVVALTIPKELNMSEVLTRNAGLFVQNLATGGWSFSCQLAPQCCVLENGTLKVNSQMCVLGATSTDFLGNVTNWMLNNVLFLIVLALILVIAAPLYFGTRR